MRLASALLAFGLCTALPAAAQTAAPAPETAANPYRELFTHWDGASEELLAAETGTARPAPAADTGLNAIPAYSPLEARSETDAVALGQRVGEVVRTGNCTEGERLAREAGDFALLRAVRAHCGRRR